MYQTNQDEGELAIKGCETKQRLTVMVPKQHKLAALIYNSISVYISNVAHPIRF